MTRTNRTMLGLAAIATTALAGLLGACTTGTGMPTNGGEPSVSITPSPDIPPAIDLVEEYLDALRADDYATAWTFLSDEAQSSYGSPEAYAETAPLDGSTGEEILASEEVDFFGTEGPEGGFILVTGTVDDGAAADAWPVVEREEGDWRIDALGVPLEGASPYVWNNPAYGAENTEDPNTFDPQQPVTITFTEGAVPGENNMIAYIDDFDFVSPEPDESGLTFTVPFEDLGSGAHTITLLWTDEDTTAFRTTTVPISFG